MLLSFDLKETEKSGNISLHMHYLKLFTRGIISALSKVTLSCQPRDPAPQARFAVLYMNSWHLFLNNRRKTWLNLLGFGRRVPQVPGSRFQGHEIFKQNVVVSPYPPPVILTVLFFSFKNSDNSPGVSETIWRNTPTQSSMTPP